MTTTVYDEIVAYFEAEDKGWCTGTMLTAKGQACLVGGVRAVVGAAYLKPNGKIFVSKDKRKWARARTIIDHIGETLGVTSEEPEEWDNGLRNVAGDYPVDDDVFVLVEVSSLEESVIGFNDARVEHSAAEAAAIEKAWIAYRVARAACDGAEAKRDAAVQKVTRKVQNRAKKKVIALVRKTGKRFPND